MLKQTFLTMISKEIFLILIQNDEEIFIVKINAVANCNNKVKIIIIIFFVCILLSKNHD
jgi:hypothetical protein